MYRSYLLMTLLFQGFFLGATDAETIQEQFQNCINQGFVSLQTAKFNEALKYFDEAKKISPEKIDAYYGMYLTYAKMHKNDLALSALEESPELQPEDPKYVAQLTLLAHAYGLHNDKVKQEKYLQKIVALPDDSMENVLLKITAYGMLKQNCEALDQSNKALALIDINTPDAIKGNIYWSLGHYTLQLKRYDEAIDHLKESLKCIQSAPTYDALGTAYRKKSDFMKAIEFYDTALEIDSSKVISWIGLAKSYRKLNRFDEAKECLQKALELDHSSASSHLNFAHVLIDEGNVEEAQTHIAILQEQIDGDELWQKRIQKCIDRIKE